MTERNNEEMENVMKTISSLESKAQQYKQLYSLLENIYAREEENFELTLSCPLDSEVTTVILREQGEPSDYMLELLELQDLHNHIRYEPEDDEYVLEATLVE